MNIHKLIILCALTIISSYSRLDAANFQEENVIETSESIREASGDSQDVHIFKRTTLEEVILSQKTTTPSYYFTQQASKDVNKKTAILTKKTGQTRVIKEGNPCTCTIGGYTLRLDGPLQVDDEDPVSYTALMYQFDRMLSLHNAAEISALTALQQDPPPAATQEKHNNITLVSFAVEGIKTIVKCDRNSQVTPHEYLQETTDRQNRTVAWHIRNKELIDALKAFVSSYGNQ